MKNLITTRYEISISNITSWYYAALPLVGHPNGNENKEQIVKINGNCVHIYIIIPHENIRKYKIKCINFAVLLSCLSSLCRFYVHLIIKK